MSSGRVRVAMRAGLAPDWIDKGLSLGAGVLILMVAAAVLRGAAHWSTTSWLIWAHLVTIVISLALTPAILLRRRGDMLHRRLGWLWALSLAATAVLSFGIRTINPGGLSPIHLLSALTLLTIPLIVWFARTHRIAAHRLTVRSLSAAALVIAGGFTFPFHRMLGRWLFW